MAGRLLSIGLLFQNLQFVAPSGLVSCGPQHVAQRPRDLAGLPDDYVDRSLALLRSVTPETATEAYRSLVDPEELTLVVVGDAERLADPLRTSGFEDLEVRPPAFGQLEP